MTSDLFGYLNKHDLDIENAPITATQLGDLVGLISEGIISGRTAKDIFAIMVDSGKDPALIVDEKGLEQVSDFSELEDIIKGVLVRGGKHVAQFRSGNEKVFGWFVGQVMQATKGRANPKTVNKILRKRLAE